VTDPPAVLVAPVNLAESLAEAPTMILEEDRLVVRVGLPAVTVSVIIVKCVSDPFVAVTFRLNTPAICPALMFRTVELHAHPLVVIFRMF
jgi:hypothetical protein